jgi:DNA-binding response OmpR family regulator
MESLTNPTIEVRRRLKVSKRILLLEPYGAVADVIKDLLDQLDYTADVETSGHVNEHDLRSRGYHCVLVNLDQNRTDWRDYGLRLATIASGLGIPVVMISDHETAAKTIKENGWLRLRKPFTIENLENTLNRAVGGKSEDG